MGNSNSLEYQYDKVSSDMPSINIPDGFIKKNEEPVSIKSEFKITRDTYGLTKYINLYIRCEPFISNKIYPYVGDIIKIEFDDGNDIITLIKRTGSQFYIMYISEWKCYGLIESDKTTLVEMNCKGNPKPIIFDRDTRDQIEILLKKEMNEYLC